MKKYLLRLKVKQMLSIAASNNLTQKNIIEDLNSQNTASTRAISF